MNDELSFEQKNKLRAKIKNLFIEELDNLEINRMLLSYNVLEIKLNTIIEILVLKIKLNNHINLDNTTCIINTKKVNTSGDSNVNNKNKKMGKITC